MAETKKDALVAFDAFIETWGVKYERAVECLIKDRDALLAFYDFRPKTGSICAPMSSKARPRRHATARCDPLDGHNQLPKVILGLKFTDGIEVVRSQAQIAAA